MEPQPPSSRKAVYTTAAALLDLFGTFMVPATRPPTAPIFPLMIMIVAEIALIAIAIREWSVYLKAYIAFEIERRIR